MADRSLPLLLLLLTLEAALPTNECLRSPRSFHRHDASCGARAARQTPTCSEGEREKGGEQRPGGISPCHARWMQRDLEVGGTGSTPLGACPAGRRRAAALRWEVQGENHPPAHTHQLHLRGGGEPDPGAGSGEGGAGPGEEAIIDEEVRAFALR